MKRILYIIAGCLAVTLAVIGIFVPGLPTTPFLLLASWLFYHSSEKLHKWLNGSWLGKYIRRYHSKDGVSLITKMASILFMTTMISISIIFFIEPVKIKILVGILGLIGICSILFLVPGQKRNKIELIEIQDEENESLDHNQLKK
ncbi:MAG: YbaN family protein [Bacteroidales bacterium]